MIGNYCVIRARDSGVHAGFVNSIEGRTVILLPDSRRLWQWRVPMGAPETLSGVASHGLDEEDSKVAQTESAMMIMDVCEVIPCTEAAHKSIHAVANMVRTR